MAAAFVFAGTYLVLAFGRIPFLRIDRPAAAIVGAILMVALGVVPLDDAYRAIDYRTIILLFGMNLTVLGSIANLIVVEGARKRGVRISFVAHLAIGLPVTIVTLAFGLWWLRTFAS